MVMEQARGFLGSDIVNGSIVVCVVRRHFIESCITTQSLAGDLVSEKLDFELLGFSLLCLMD